MNLYKNKNVLVTGGTGLIGRPLVELLLQAGSNVRVVSMDDPTRCPEGAEFLKGNLMHLEFCLMVADGIDYVFHAAGIKGSVGIGRNKAASFFVPALMINTNMMEAARQAGVARYLFTSSLAVYPPAQILREEDAWSGDPHPTDKYAAWMKRIGELQAETYKLEYGWEKIAIVRPTGVYGPWDNFDKGTAMAVAALIRRVADGEDPLVVWGDGSAIRDLIFSYDVARGMMLALEKAANCTPINLGSGKGTSIRELVETIVSHFPKRDVVWDVTKESGDKIRLMDTTRAKEMLGFEPEVTLKEGIRATVEWYLAYRNIANKRFNIFHQGIPL